MSWGLNNVLLYVVGVIQAKVQQGSRHCALKFKA